MAADGGGITEGDRDKRGGVRQTISEGQGGKDILYRRLRRHGSLEAFERRKR